MQDRPIPEQVQRQIEREIAEAKAEASRVGQDNEAARPRRERLREGVKEDRWKGGDLPADLLDQTDHS